MNKYKKRKEVRKNKVCTKKHVVFFSKYNYMLTFKRVIQNLQKKIS